VTKDDVNLSTRGQQPISSPSCHKRRCKLIKLVKQGVCHTVALPFYIKKDLKAKEEELWKLKYFTMQK
jgi:hypothetical protein